MKTKKLFQLLILLFLTQCGNAKNNSSTKMEFDKVKQEVEWYINKVKPESLYKGRHNVYMVRASETENGFCLTIGFIQDTLFFSYLKEFKYYLELNGDLVLLKCSRELLEQWRRNEIHPVASLQIVSNRINHNEVVIGDTPGYVYCDNKGDVLKTYYDNSDDVPVEEKLFIFKPKGPVIRLDSNALKQRLKMKNKKNGH